MTQKTILIVEDDFLIAQDYMQTLEGLGWRIMGPVANVKDALLLLSTEVPQVALFDINLGNELVSPVARKLKSLNVPFILASAYDDIANLHSDILDGAESITKPFNPQTLIAALNKVI